MADTIANLVENMNLDEEPTNGEPSSEPTPTTDQKPGSGPDDSGNGNKEPGQQSPGSGEPESGSGGDAESNPEPEEPTDPDAGYVADEVEDEPTKSEPSPPSETGQTLTPELQYVVDRLPLLSVRGRDRTYQVKAAGQLPEDFEFANKHEELVFNQALAAQEFKAQQLLNEYNSKKQQETFEQYSERENADIRHDIGDLQREGELPKFQYLPQDKRFNDDPAVKAVQEIMDYMTEKNDAYAKANRPYRITFRDAYDQLLKQIQKETPETTAQAKEDNERKEVSRRTGAGRTANANPAPKARVARSMEDLMSRIDSYDFA
jgi:hypothetical protein